MKRNEQGHPVFPLQAFRDRGSALARIFGVPVDELKSVIQSINNRIALFPDHDRAATVGDLHARGLLGDAPIGAARHKGSHPRYNQAVIATIEAIINDTHLDDAGKRVALIDFQANARAMLQSGELPLDADVDTLRAYFDRHRISTPEILSQGKRYNEALERGNLYLKRDDLHPKTMGDSVTRNADGKFTNASSSWFVKGTASALARVSPEGEKLAKAIGDGTLDKQSVKTLREAVSKAFDAPTSKTRVSPEGNELTKAIGDGKLRGTASELRASLGELFDAQRFDAPVTANKGLFRNPGGRGTLFRDVAHTLTHSNVAAGNILVKGENGRPVLNPKITQGGWGRLFGEYLGGGKIGAAAMVVDFVDNTYDALKEAVQTGNWDKFQEQAKNYGKSAVTGLIVFTAIVEALGFIPVVGPLAIGLMMVASAGYIGYSLGNLMHKVWNDIGGWFGLPRGERSYYIYYDPLALDLDGGGLETLAADGFAGALFDGDTNGLRTASGWIAKEDGLLVLDRDGDGIINDGRELFGERVQLDNGALAADGFAALADLDSNDDGTIDAGDSAFDRLRIWQDKNSDGISEAEELHRLADFDITALELAHEETWETVAGGTVVKKGRYRKSDGTSGELSDLNFTTENQYSQYRDSVALTSEQMQRANLKGMGFVRDLREAAAGDAHLADLLERYSAARTKNEQMSLLPALVEAWAHTAYDAFGIDPKMVFRFVLATGGGGGSFRMTLATVARMHKEKGAIVESMAEFYEEYSHKIAILDAFTGQHTQELSLTSLKESESAQQSIRDAYQQVSRYVYQGLLLQTRLQPYLGELRLEKGEDGGIEIDFSALHDSFARLHASDPVKATVDLKELLDTKFFAPLESTPLLRQLNDFITTATTDGRFEEIVRAFASSAFHLAGTNEEDTLTVKTGSSDWVVDGLDGNDSLYGGAEHDILRGGGGNDRVYGKDGNDIIFGGAGNDNLRGGDGEDILDGGGGDDRLEGGDEADTLDGGAGNDHLEGGNFSADTYLFARGHGRDTVSEYTSRDKDSDTLRFAAAASGDAVFSRSGNDLVIAAYGGDDQVSVENYFSNFTYRFLRLDFMDKTLTVDDLARSAFTFSGTETNDVLSGWVSADTIAGLGGDDRIYGGGGEDTLSGGAGDDTLDGQDGDDRVNGGDGNDTLSGGNGDDRLDGGAGNDTLRGDADADILVGGAGDDRLEGGNYAADTYVFAKGHGKDVVSDQAYRDEDRNTLRFAGAASGDAVFSRRGNDLVIAAYGGDDQVRIERYFSDRYHRYFTFAFSDTTLTVDDLAKRAFTFSGTEANDSLSGWVSADTIAGGAGDDRIYGGGGEDTLTGGAGDDRLEGGNYSADTYVFAKGHGKDTVSDYASRDEESDTLRFADSAAADLWFTRKDYDLAIETLGTEDQVLISNWFSSANYRRFDVQSSDGKAIDNDQVAQLVSAMAVFGAGENDAAASIVEQKRAFLASIGAAEI